MKKSLKGLICVDKDANGNYRAIDQVSKDLEQQGCLHTVFEDGKLMKDWTLAEVRANLNETLC